MSLARLDFRRQHREDARALEGCGELFLGGGFREYQDHGAGHPDLGGFHGGAHVLDRARVDHQHLGSLAAGHALQGLVRGFDRAHPGLPAERLAELEQEVIAAGYNGDIDHRQ